MDPDFNASRPTGSPLTGPPQSSSNNESLSSSGVTTDHRQVINTETSPQIQGETHQERPVPETAIEQRQTDKTESTGGIWQGITSAIFGGRTTTAQTGSKELPPQSSDNRNLGERIWSGITTTCTVAGLFVKDFAMTTLGTGISAATDIKAARSGTSNKTGSTPAKPKPLHITDNPVQNTDYSPFKDAIREFTGVEFNIDDAEWGRLMKDVMFNVTGKMKEDGQFHRFKLDVAIPTKNGPLKLNNVVIELRAVTNHNPSALIGKQKLVNSYEIRQMQCQVELPRANKEPLKLKASLSNAQATLGVDRNKLLTWTKAEQDSGLHLKAKELTLRFDDIHADIGPLKKTGGKAAGLITSINRGQVVLKEFEVGRPMDLLKTAEDHSSVLHFKELTFKNSPVRDDTVLGPLELNVSDVDDHLNGQLHCKLEVNLSPLAGTSRLGSTLAFLFGGKTQIEIDAPMKLGEVSLDGLKRAVKVSSENRFFTWIINRALNSLGTKIVRFPSGQYALKLGVPLLKHLFSPRIPLPIPGFATDDSQGKIIVADLAGDVVGGLLKGWGIIPGPLRVVSKQQEALCVAAAAGSVEDARALLSSAHILAQRQHSADELRALQAIPTESYLQLIKDRSLAQKERFVDIAHKLAPLDTDKALSIFCAANGTDKTKTFTLLAWAQELESKRQNSEALKIYQKIPTEAYVELLKTADIRLKHHCNEVALQLVAVDSKKALAIYTALKGGDSKKGKARLAFAWAQVLEGQKRTEDALKLYMEIDTEDFVELVNETNPGQLYRFQAVAEKLKAPQRDKSDVIYTELLKRRHFSNKPEAATPELLADIAAAMPDKTAEDVELTLLTLEFAYRTGAGSEAFLQLVNWVKRDLYSSERLTNLISNMIKEGHYSNNPEELASVISVLGSAIGPAVTPLLDLFQMDELVSKARDGDLKSMDLVMNMVNLLRAHGRIPRAADLYIEIGEPGMAEAMLQEGIDNNNLEALKKRFNLEVYEGTLGHSDCMAACQFLKQQMLSGTSSLDLKRQSGILMIELLMNSRDPKFAQAFMDPMSVGVEGNPYAEALMELCSMNPKESGNPSEFLKVLKQAKETIKETPFSPLAMPIEHDLLPSVELALDDLIKMYQPMQEAYEQALEAASHTNQTPSVSFDDEESTVIIDSGPVRQETGGVVDQPLDSPSIRTTHNQRSSRRPD